MAQFRQFAPELQTVSYLAHLVKHAMGPVWDIDGDLSSAQLGEGLGIKDEEESAFLLETEKIKKCYVKKKGHGPPSSQ